MRQARTCLALVAAGLLLLTGCTDDGAQADPEPIIPSSSSAQPSPDEPTESPTEEPPEMPAAASERTRDGAAEFARYWVMLFNHAQLTGETAPMMAVSDPRCVSCGDAEALIDNVYKDGGTVDSDGWRVRQIGYDPLTPIDEPLISSSIRQTPEKVTFRSPRRVERTEGSIFTVLFRVVRDDSRWSMREVEVR